MSTDDRQDEPEFPGHDGADGSRDSDGASTASTPPLPEFPGWQAPGAETAAQEPAADATTPVAAEPTARPVEIPEPIDMPSEERAAPVHDADTTATRAPLGGPYVVGETATPVAVQAVSAYDRPAQGGPYVTASEPASEAVTEAEAQAQAQAESAAESRPTQTSPADDPARPADTSDRTPYPAAAFAPASGAAVGAASGSTGAFGASAAGASGAPAGAPAGDPAPVSDAYPPYQPVPQTAAPRPPQPKGNRGAGSLIALLGTAVFAVLFAVVSFFVIAANLTGDAAVTAFVQFLQSAAFIVPVVVFALALVLIVLIVNRAGWWAYVLGGFFVAVLVYFAGIAGALIHVKAWEWQPQEQFDFVRSLTMDPLTLGGAIVAREVAIWTGALIALRGRRVKAKNAAAREEFARGQAEERESALQRDENRNPTSGEAPVTTW